MCRSWAISDWSSIGVGMLQMLWFPRCGNSTTNMLSHHHVRLFPRLIEKYGAEFTNTLWKASMKKMFLENCHFVTFGGCDIFLRIWNKKIMLVKKGKKEGDYRRLKSWTPLRETVWPQSKLGTAVKKVKRKRAEGEMLKMPNKAGEEKWLERISVSVRSA